jgi:general secretion pathway protein J
MKKQTQRVCSSIKGFTLFEVLIALFVFLIIAMLISSVLHTVFKTMHSLNGHYRHFQRLSIMQILMRRDCAGALNRVAYTQKNELIKPFVGDKTSFATMTIMSDGSFMPSRMIQYVRYHFRRQVLSREVCLIEKAKISVCSERVLMTGLKSLRFTYVNLKKQLQNTWGKTTATDFPYGVRCEMELSGQGKIVMTLRMPGRFNYAKS